jgi:hypothetical protein
MDNGIFILFMFIGATVAAVVASSKQRNVVGWLIAGALFPLISIIAILCLPPAAPEGSSPAA